MKFAPRPTRAALVAAAAAAVAAALHAASALRTPVGAASDDALHLLLARNLWSGAYALPDAAGTPATDPLPGFPLLMALPVRLFAPHWSWLRGAELLTAAAAAVLLARLSRRLSGAPAAAAAAFILCANPVLVGWAGVALPDAPFLAAAAAAFLLLSAPALSVSAVAAAAAAAALLRPEGVVLAPALAVGVAQRAGPRRAAAFLAAALAPLGLWLLRDQLVAGSATAYLEHWRASGASADHGLLAQAADLAAGLARGLYGTAPAPLLAAGSVFALAAAVFGARELLRARERATRAVSAATLAYLAGLTVLHLGWRFWFSRYALPFVAAAIPLFAAAFAALDRRSRAAAAAVLLLAAAPGLREAVGYARAGLAAPRTLPWPRTQAWLEANVPAGAPLVGREAALAALLTGRRVYFPEAAASRAVWLSGLRARGIGFVLVRREAPRGYLSSSARVLLADFDAWAVPAPPLSVAYSDPEEGIEVLSLKPSRAAARPSAR